MNKTTTIEMLKSMKERIEKVGQTPEEDIKFFMEHDKEYTIQLKKLYIDTFESAIKLLGEQESELNPVFNKNKLTAEEYKRFRELDELHFNDSITIKQIKELIDLYNKMKED